MCFHHTEREREERRQGVYVYAIQTVGVAVENSLFF